MKKSLFTQAKELFSDPLFLVGLSWGFTIGVFVAAAAYLLFH